MDITLTQLLAVVSLLSTCGACFSTGVAVALWNQRSNSALVPVLVQRLDTLEEAVNRLTGQLSSMQLGRTHFTRE